MFHIYKRNGKIYQDYFIELSCTGNDIESIINCVHLRWHNLNCLNKITQRQFHLYIINGLQTTIAKIFFKDFGIWHSIRHNVVS